MTITLVRPGDQRLFIASRDVPRRCHLAREPRSRTADRLDGLSQTVIAAWAGKVGPLPMPGHPTTAHARLYARPRRRPGVIMGFARRAVRKSARRATPRPVRKATHPARTARNAVTPRPVKQVSRAGYTAHHPVGAAENEVIGAALYPPRRRKRGRVSCLAYGLVVGLIVFFVNGWLAVGVIVLAIVILIIASRYGSRRAIPPRPAPPAAGPPAVRCAVGSSVERPGAAEMRPGNDVGSIVGRLSRRS